MDLIESFQCALVDLAVDGKVFAADANPSMSAACYIVDQCFSVPPALDLTYVDSLLKICIDNNIGMVVPTIDSELLPLAQAAHRFEDIGCELVLSEKFLIESCRDKRITAKLFGDIGIEVPEIYPVENIVFPCFCKPYDGSRSEGAKPIYSKDSLSSDVIDNKKNIYMELIGPEYKEYTVDVYFKMDGGIACLVPRERLEVRSGEVSKAITVKDFAYSKLLAALVKLRGARGCVTVQVFVNRNEEKIKGIEINPRFGGGYPLSLAAGANFSKMLVQEYILREELEFYDQWEVGLKMLRYDSKVIVSADG